MPLTKVEIIEYLNFLENEVVAILIHDKMFKETTTIIQSNKSIFRKNTFYDWMVNAYVSDIIIRIRRSIDERRDVRSILRFLMEIKKEPTFRTKEMFINQCKSLNPTLPEIEALAERDFYSIAGNGSRFFSDDLIQKDIDDLKSKCEKIEIFSNSFITHSSLDVKDGHSHLEIPTFTDVNDAILFLEELVKKYILLFRGVQKGTLMPIWQYDWKTIFETPWIQKP